MVGGTAMPLGLPLPRALSVGFTSLAAAYGDNPDDWVPTSLAQLGGLDLVYGDVGEGMPAAWWEKETETGPPLAH